MNRLQRVYYMAISELCKSVGRVYEKMIIEKCNQGKIEISKGNYIEAEKILIDVTALEYFPNFLKSKSRILEGKL